jgi:hypothetical protein
MGSEEYPWGPHGPRVDAHSVTPNPTAPYVEPAWNSQPYPTPSAPAPGYYGSAAPSQPYAAGATTFGPGGLRRFRKSYILAVVLAFFFGPLGLFYATKKGALLMLAVLVGVPIALCYLGIVPGAVRGNPFSVLDNYAVMNRMWTWSVFLSVLSSVIAVRARNASR